MLEVNEDAASIDVEGGTELTISLNVEERGATLDEARVDETGLYVEVALPVGEEAAELEALDVIVLYVKELDGLEVEATEDANVVVDPFHTPLCVYVGMYPEAEARVVLFKSAVDVLEIEVGKPDSEGYSCNVSTS